MPIVNDPVEPPKPNPPPQGLNATIEQPTYKHALVDLKVTPVSSLLVHIEGSSLTVDYYSQVLGGSEQPCPFQESQPGVYQQYMLVKGYELKLQGSLGQSSDGETQRMTVSGNATMYPFLAPNYGDMFIADIGDGRAGFFAVSSAPNNKSILKETGFEIAFELVRYVDQALIDKLHSRVIKTTHFVRDFLTYGQNPILADVDLLTKETAELQTRQLLNRWLTRFYSREFKTILVPGQTGATYDPYIVDVILKLFDRNEHPLIAKIRQLNCDELPQIDDFVLWNALIRLDPMLVLMLSQKTWLIDTKYFSSYPVYDGIYFSGVVKVVYPHQVDDSVDNDYACQILQPAGEAFKDLEDMNVSLGTVYQYNVAGGFEDPGDFVEPTVTTEELPLIHPVLLDDYYVFSQNFYDKVAGAQSLLEVLTNDYLAGNAVDKDKLFSICEDIKTKKWGRLEEYYYIPVLLILLKHLIRKI
jgi:hypothetical protein